MPEGGVQCPTPTTSLSDIVTNRFSVFLSGVDGTSQLERVRTRVTCTRRLSRRIWSLVFLLKQALPSTYEVKRYEAMTVCGLQIDPSSQNEVRYHFMKGMMTFLNVRKLKPDSSPLR